MRKKTAPPIQGPSHPSYGPQALFWGSIAWKWIGEASNVDFLMSIQPHGLRESFQLLLDYGVVLIAVVGILWWVAIYRKWIERPSWPQTVCAVAFMSFLWGVLIAVEATSGVPKIVTEWGGKDNGCIAKFDVSQIQKYKKKFDIALACGIKDPRTDILTDTGISISGKFNIPPNSFEVFAIYSPSMAQPAGRPSAAAARPVRATAPRLEATASALKLHSPAASESGAVA